MRMWLAFVLALSLAGCARNAVTEVNLTLPAATDEVRFAVVEASEDDLGDDPFSVQWSPTGFAPIPLGRGPTAFPVSVVSGGFRGDTLLRVSFCAQEDCLSAGPPRDPIVEVRARVEQPFYTGTVTRTSLSLDGVLDTGDTLPSSCVREGVGVVGCLVERCRVEGCSVGTGSEFCVDGLTGAHFCE